MHHAVALAGAGHEGEAVLAYIYFIGVVNIGGEYECSGRAVGFGLSVRMSSLNSP